MIAAKEVLKSKLISLLNFTLALVITKILPPLYELAFLKGFIPFHDPVKLYGSILISTRLEDLLIISFIIFLMNFF